MKKWLLAILLVSLLACSKDIPESFDNFETGTLEMSNDITILSFNIQILGRSKSLKKNVMKVIIDIIDDFDIIAIQEIRDASTLTIDNLKELMPDNYGFVLGPREGRSSSKEQALYIYDMNKVQVGWDRNFDDTDDVYERSPYMVLFKVSDMLEFVIINVHVSPSKAPDEIKELEKLMDSIESEGHDVILLGDLNADGNYYNEDGLEYLFNDFTSIIKNTFDTTVALSDNTYDRIIISNNLNNYVKDFGVIYYEDYLLDDVLTKHVSDHYPVYVKLEY